MQGADWCKHRLLSMVKTINREFSSIDILQVGHFSTEKKCPICILCATVLQMKVNTVRDHGDMHFSLADGHGRVQWKWKHEWKTVQWMMKC